MTGVFDGMAPALNDEFGAGITWTPGAGAPVALTGIFREEPVEVAGDDGRPVLIGAAFVRLRRDQCAGLKRGDTIAAALAPGRVFRVANRLNTASPAADGFVLVALEEVDP